MLMPGTLFAAGAVSEPGAVSGVFLPSLVGSQTAPPLPPWQWPFGLLTRHPAVVWLAMSSALLPTALPVSLRSLSPLLPSGRACVCFSNTAAECFAGISRLPVLGSWRSLPWNSALPSQNVPMTLLGASFGPLSAEAVPNLRVRGRSPAAWVRMACLLPPRTTLQASFSATSHRLRLRRSARSMPLPTGTLLLLPLSSLAPTETWTMFVIWSPCG